MERARREERTRWEELTPLREDNQDYEPEMEGTRLPMQRSWSTRSSSDW